MSEVTDRGRGWLLLLVVILLLGVGPFQPHAAGGTQSQSGGIEPMMDRFLVAFSSRDIAAFSEFFADDATMFFPPSAFGPPSGRVQGRDSIAEGFKELYARTGPPRNPGATIQPQDMQIQTFDGFAAVTFHPGSDSMRGRRSFVLRRFGPDWKIVHLHASTAEPRTGR